MSTESNTSESTAAATAEFNARQAELVATQPPTPATPTKMELHQAKLADARAAKAVQKVIQKAATALSRANGVIGTLHQALLAPAGTTKAEILAALTAKFPTRDPIGMGTTVGIQLSRLQKKHGKIVSRKVDGRGTVYGYASSIQFPPEQSNGNGTAPAVVAEVVIEEQAAPVVEAAPAPKAERLLRSVQKATGSKKRR